MKKTYQKIILSSLFSVILFTLFSQNAEALTIFSKKPDGPINTGDTVLVGIMVNTDSKEINAMEGSVVVSGAKIISINTAGSIFSLWPNKPSVEGTKISFVGGGPSGVSGNNLRLFTIALQPTSAGSITIQPTSITAFLNDGKGTKLNASNLISIIPVVSANQSNRDDLASQIISDTKSPMPFIVELGREISLFDNKYFISFFTTDDDSGILRYEVTEGQNPPVRSGSPYVLQDQSLSSKVTVRAFDNAGNVSEATLDPKTKSTKNTTLTIISLIIIGLMAFRIFYKRKR